MRNYRNNQELRTIRPLTSGETYIYVLETQSGLIKIGQSSNIKQRIASLGGSNGRDDNIIRFYCSEPTIVRSLERTMHSIYSEHRIPGTEWFSGITFEDVCFTLNDVIHSKEYETISQARKQMKKSAST